MSKKIRAVVSGLGRIAWSFHLPAMARDERFEIVAVADPSEDRLQEAVQKYPGIRTYCDYDQMLSAEKDADMAVIASPTTFHCRQTIAALERNMAVFLEKPMCESLEKAQVIYDTVQKLNGKVMMYQPHRVHLETLALKELVLDKLGKITHTTRKLTFFNRRNDWQSRTEFGGGMLNNYGAHYIDQFYNVFGTGEPAVKGCLMQRTVGIGDAEDLVNVLLMDKSEVSFNLEINLGSAESVNSWDVYGTLGCAHWDNLRDHWLLTYVKPGTLNEMTMQTTLAAQNRSYSLEGDIPWITEKVMLNDATPIDYYDQIYKYVAEDKTPFVPLDETMSIMRTMAKCREISAGE